MPETLKKHTLLLRDGDFDYLGRLFEDQGITASVFIRKLVSKTVDSYRERLGEDESVDLEVDITIGGTDDD